MDEWMDGQVMDKLMDKTKDYTKFKSKATLTGQDFLVLLYSYSPST